MIKNGDTNTQIAAIGGMTLNKAMMIADERIHLDVLLERIILQCAEVSTSRKSNLSGTV
jgi:hypothetical protein